MSAGHDLNYTHGDQIGIEYVTIQNRLCGRYSALYSERCMWQYRKDLPGLQHLDEFYCTVKPTPAEEAVVLSATGIDMVRSTGVIIALCNT